MSNLNDQSKGIVIIAQVGESTTGHTVTAEKSIGFISAPYQSGIPALSMVLEPNLHKFAPGLPYVTFVSL